MPRRSQVIRLVFRYVVVISLVVFAVIFLQTTLKLSSVPDALSGTGRINDNVVVPLPRSRVFPKDNPVTATKIIVEPPEMNKRLWMSASGPPDIDTFDYSMGKYDRNGPINNYSVLPRSKLKVIVVPFTHTDPGWRRTFDEYSVETDDTLDAMHPFLKSHPDMTFMWAETIFLERWWRQQNDSVKADVRQLVKEGRFDLVTGSWVMTDEANPYYPVSVDNIIEGFQFIAKEFGVKPSVLFTLDPFGHSNSVAYLYKQAGVHREVINRISTDIKDFLRKKAHRFLWKQHFDQTGETAMLTHVLPYYHYDIPSSCGPSPLACCHIDFLRHYKKYTCFKEAAPVTKDNMQLKADTLSTQLRKMSDQYISDVVIMFYGDDFRFTTPFEWKVQYDGLRQVFDVINSQNAIDIRFGTISDFFKELENWYEKNDVQPPSLTGDFFPYKIGVGAWTGYYTTRPFFKSQERRLHWLLRTADLLSSQAQHIVPRTEQTLGKLEKARKAVLLFQHHDAITGTSTRSVMKDYSEQLHHATIIASSVIEASVEAIAASKSEQTVEHYISSSSTTSLKVLNITEKTELTLKVINTLPYQLEDVVSVRVDCVTVSVMERGQQLEAQIEPYIHNGKIDGETFLLSFRAHLQPLGISQYQLVFSESHGFTQVAAVKTAARFVSNLMDEGLHSMFKSESLKNGDNFELMGRAISTRHNAETGMLESVTMRSGKKFDLKPSFLVYDSNGGAYEMNIREATVKSFFLDDPVKYYAFIEGSVQNSVHVFANGLYCGFTLKKVDGILGEQLNYLFHVNKQFPTNKELAFTFSTSFKFPSFYSDSLGIQLLRRKERIFFPMPTSAVIEDNDNRITVSSNVPHGCRQIDKNVEVIIERSIHTDDGHGLGDRPDAIPNDNLPVDMRFSILIEELAKDNTDYSHYTVHTSGGHLSVQSTIYQPVMLLSKKSSSTSPGVTFPPLPCNLQLLNVRSLPSGKHHLLTIFNNGVRATNEARSECSSGSFMKFLSAYFEALGAKKVQETDMAGVDVDGPVFNSATANELEPFKFLSLLVTI